MSDKHNKLKKLKRIELLELLLEQAEKNEQLVKENSELKEVNKILQKKLEDKTIRLEKAGTVAEAAFVLNGVYEATEQAAALYLESLQELCESQKKKKLQTQEYCRSLILETQRRCEIIIENARKQSDELKSET